MGFILTILFIISGFYFLGAILRIVLRIWLSRKMKDFQKNGGYGAFTNFGSKTANNSGYYKEPPKAKEGEVKISIEGEEQKKVNEKVGEYVEFDEIK